MHVHAWGEGERERVGGLTGLKTRKAIMRCSEEILGEEENRDSNLINVKRKQEGEIVRRNGRDWRSEGGETKHCGRVMMCRDVMMKSSILYVNLKH